MDKNDTGRRSHYLTVQFSINDAPAGNELIAALGAATSGRPHHRIGDRYSDLNSLGRTEDNPAGVLKEFNCTIDKILYDKIRISINGGLY